MDGFGSRLLHLRLERDLSQRTVGGAIGVSGAIVSEWEGGRKKPREDNLESLAKFFCVSTRYLRDGTFDSEISMVTDRETTLLTFCRGMTEEQQDVLLAVARTLVTRNDKPE